MEIKFWHSIGTKWYVAHGSRACGLFLACYPGQVPRMKLYLHAPDYPANKLRQGCRSLEPSWLSLQISCCTATVSDWLCLALNLNLALADQTFHNFSVSKSYVNVSDQHKIHWSMAFAALKVGSGHVLEPAILLARTAVWSNSNWMRPSSLALTTTEPACLTDPFTDLEL